MVEEIKDSVDTGRAINISKDKSFNIIDNGKKEQKSVKSVVTNNWLYNAPCLLKDREIEKPIIKSIMRNMEKSKTLINNGVFEWVGDWLLGC